MLYLLAILLPPLAVLMAGKPFQAILNLVACVTLIGWLPAAVHALFVAHNHYADQRQERLIRETRKLQRGE